MRSELTDLDLERMFTLDAGAGPARAIDAGAEAAIVAAALSGAGFAPRGGGGGGGGGAKLSLIGGGLVITAAIVAIVLVRRPSSVDRRPEADLRPQTSDLRLSDPDDGRPTTDDDPVIIDTPVIVTAEKPKTNAVTSPAKRDHHVETPAAPHVETAPAPAPAPQDLLAEANAARAAKDWAKADGLYAQVAGMKNAFAAQTALVADGQLRLEHMHDANGAIERFRAALAMNSRGALAEDARWGLAEAEKARGDRAAEAKALDDFLAHHADSPLADRARARRKELAAP